METMQAAKQQESVVCGQASKFGKLAKEKEKLKSESTKSKSGSATSKSESSATSTPKDINDLNSDHDLPSNTHTSMDDAGSRPKNPHAHGGAKTANSGNENKLKYARLPPPTGDDMRIAASASGQLEASSAGVAALALALAIVSML
ncbi:hypothetical protein GGI12_002581 [Dipsacomyces acuminosporus]|nr:hypothetical protein GGI12_002581 [Dipsacomyces acuminosporus]